MKLFRYFTQGLLIIVPIGITIIILLKIYSLINSLLEYAHLPSNNLISVVLVVLAVLSVIILLGMFAGSFIFKGLFSFLEKVIESTPGIKHVYSPVKDFMQAFVGNKKKFNKPVLVLTNPAAGIEELGFITDEDLAEFSVKGKVAVYMPHSYAFSGRLIFVPSENLRILDTKPSDTMKYIVTGGVADVNED